MVQGAIVVLVIALSVLSAKAAPLIDCNKRKICDSLWTAAEGAGDGQRYFRRGTALILGDQIKVGDVLTSDRTINIRRKPADWTGELAVIPSRTSVTVREVAPLPLPNGDIQVWIRIDNPDIATAIAPAPVSPPASPGATAPKPAPPVATPAVPVPAPPATVPVVSPCLTPPIDGAPLPVPLQVLPPPPISSPPTQADIARLIAGREMYCDQNGLIIHRHADTGLPDPGDTAQREGFYWLGVWLRDNIAGLPKWDRQRKLTFERVLELLEPNRDGRFRRHPIYEPNDPDYGLSIDQFVPLVAAMGVRGKYDVIQRLFDAMPEDAAGKHTFNGEWRTLVGNWPGENCTDIRKRQCNAAECPLKHYDPECSQPEDTRDCGTDVDTRDCSGIGKIACEIEKAGANQRHKQTCEFEKGKENARHAADKYKCELDKAAKQAANRGEQAACISGEAIKKTGCELDKASTYQACRLGQKFTGDWITPAASNLIARALNKDPLTNNWIFILLGSGTIWPGGAAGETQLWGDARVRVKLSNDRDNVGDDLNMLVYLAMAKRFHGTPLSDDARHYYFNERKHSYGSYLRAFYARYGADSKDMKDRMRFGIENGSFTSDTNAVLGAIRWYNRAAEGANPELARLWEPIIDWLKN